MRQSAPATIMPKVELNQLSKSFGDVVACERVSLALWPGEVHVLLGENGAGKSTLVSMLSGLHRPDSGVVRVDGRPEKLTSPRRALELGIGTVFQHSMMVPELSLIDNIALGNGTWWRRPDRQQIAAELRRIGLEIGIHLDPLAKAGTLSLGELQQAEIVRTLLRGSRVIVLDEATAMLAPHHAEELGQLMGRLVSRGLAVVFITHRLNEALAWGDRISVLRQGRKVGELTPDQLNDLSQPQAVEEIMQLMFNLQNRPAALAAARISAISKEAPARLDIQRLKIPDPVVPISAFELRVAGGEILGIAGIDGNGQKQLAEGLAGQRPLSAGHIYLDGEPIEGYSVGERRRRGLSYVTDDRLGEGTVAGFSVAVNLLLKQIGEPPFWRRGLEQPTAIAGYARARARQFDIRTPSIDSPIASLSGGNIQKVLLARELGKHAKAVIFAKPTHGLDVKNIQSIRQRIRQTAIEGAAVILISTDLEELLALADNIVVMSRGVIIGRVRNQGDARLKVAELMSGVGQ